MYLKGKQNTGCENPGRPNETMSLDAAKRDCINNPKCSGVQSWQMKPYQKFYPCTRPLIEHHRPVLDLGSVLYIKSNYISLEIPKLFYFGKI